METIHAARLSAGVKERTRNFKHSVPDLLRGLGISCACVLLFAPFTQRTTWIPAPNFGSRITEGVGWLAAAASLGFLALLGLMISHWFRDRMPITVLGAVAATIAFAITAIGLSRHWIDLTNGITSVRPRAGWTLYPAPLVPFFAAVAAIGAGLAAMLVIQKIWTATEISRQG